MNWQRTYAVFLRQMYIIRNLPSRVVPYLLWAVLDIVLWGFITRYLNQVGGASFSFTPVILGAVVFWDFMQRVQQGVTIPFLEDIWSRNLLNTFASPMTVVEYLAGFVMSSVVTSLFGLVILIALAEVFFGLSMFSLGAIFAPAVFILFFFGIALGIVGAAIVLRLGPWAEWFTWPIPALLSPLVGVFYPVSVLPQWMQYISHLLPPTGVFQVMRDTLTGAPLPPLVIAHSALLAGIYLLLAYTLFVLTYRTVVRKGLIARYSAEGE